MPHTFRNIGDAPGRRLVVVTPGGFERMSVDAAARALTIPADIGAFVALAAEYGVEILGPPSA